MAFREEGADKSEAAGTTEGRQHDFCTRLHRRDDLDELSQVGRTLVRRDISLQRDILSAWPGGETSC